MYLACVCIIYMFDKGAVLLLNVAVVWISPHHDCGAESCRNVIQFILSCNYNVLTFIVKQVLSHW